MEAFTDAHFKQNYQKHLRNLKLNGSQPKTIKAYSFPRHPPNRGIIVNQRPQSGIGCRNGTHEQAPKPLFPR